MQRQLGLFPGVTRSEDQLEAILQPLYPKLWSSIRGPFDELLERRTADPWFRVYTEGESAQAMRPIIASRLGRAFKDDPSVSIRTYRNQFFLNYNDQLAITPKKFKPRWLGRGLTFSSAETEQNSLWWQQQSADGLPNLPRIIVGYLFVDEMTDIKILVAYPRGKDLRLCYLMPDQGDAGIKVAYLPEDVTAEDLDKGYEVAPKKDVRKRGS